MVNEQEYAMKRLQMYNFSMAEAVLFLDSHPDNKEAIEFFNKYQKLTRQALKDYTEKYGPVTADNMPENKAQWQWVKGPWPWEGV